MASRKDLDNSEMVEELQICEFENYTIFTPRYFNMAEFKSWKNDMLFRTENIPQNLHLILETLDFREKIEKKGKMPKFSYKKLVASILSFEAGTINYDKNIAIKCVWRPGASVLGNKFEFGFFVPVNFIPSKTFTTQPFMNVNGNNNEWSFGSDKIGNAQAIVFDIFDDILLKIRILRYNNINEKVFLQLGRYNNVSDFLQYSMVDFNSHIFYPKYRKVSFVSKFTLDWFEAFIYAEDVLPKGIYGTNLLFMTPNKSFKFKFRISAFIDCYDLIKFDYTESFFPAQSSLSLLLVLL